MKNKDQHIINELKALHADKLIEIKVARNEIPENYFKQLNANILERTNTNDNKKKFIFRSYILPFSIAASLLLLVSLVFLNRPEDNLNAWNSISQKDLTNYLNDHIEEFTAEEIASISNKDIKLLEFYEESSNDEFIDYLLESEITDEEMF